MYEISVVSYQGTPPAEPISAVFGRDGGTIGRGPANTLVLSDPNRFVSRLQAKVICVGDRIAIVNASKANPLLLNDRELDAGEQVPLADGDELRVGLYLLKIRHIATVAPVQSDSAQVTLLSAGPMRSSRSPAAESGAVLPPTPPAISVLGPADPLELQFGSGSGDPFADLLPSAPQQKTTPTAEAPHVSDIGAPLARANVGVSRHPSGGTQHVSDTNTPFAEAGVGVSGQPSANAPAIPDRVWDELARLTPKAPPLEPGPLAPLPANFDAFTEPSHTSRNAEDPLAEFAQSAIALDSLDKLDTPIDKLFIESSPLPGAHAQDLLPDPHAPVPDPLAGVTNTVDPIAIFGDEEAKLRIASEAMFSRSEPDHAPELQALFRPPEARFDGSGGAVSAAQRAPAPMVDAPAREVPTPMPPRGYAAIAQPFVSAPESGSPDERLLQGLLAGLGIPNAIVKGGMTPDLMQRIGEMLAAAVQGTIELIATRALLKREVKADVTIIASTRNNPLKFLPDAESALLQMFGGHIPGFMAPVEAMEDAFKDLRAHEVGVIAGMHAALAQILRRFEPAELEKRLKPAGLLEDLMPHSHDARLWRAFTEMYVDISREAQDDFHSLFGKAFLQAYEEEVSRLKGK